MTSDNDVDELFYITDLLDFATWTEKELNGLHAMYLTQDELNVINLVFDEKLTKKELKKQGITSGLLVYLLFD